MTLRRRTPLRARPRRREPPASRATPYASLGPQSPVYVSTACEAGPAQVKEGPTYRNEAYIADLHNWPCAFAAIDPEGCRGRITASHHWPHMNGRKGVTPPDNRAYSACEGHHLDEHHGQGSLAGRTGWQKAALIETEIVKANDRWTENGGTW